MPLEFIFEDLRDIFEDKWSVSDKIEELRKSLAERPTLRFSEIFARAESRSEIVATFLALLELIRLRHLVCLQPEAFGDIEISRAPVPPPASQAEPAANDNHLNTQQPAKEEDTSIKTLST